VEQSNKINSRIKQKTDEGDVHVDGSVFCWKSRHAAEIDSWRVSINLLSLSRRLYQRKL